MSEVSVLEHRYQSYDYIFLLKESHEPNLPKRLTGRRKTIGTLEIFMHHIVYSKFTRTRAGRLSSPMSAVSASVIPNGRISSHHSSMHEQVLFNSCRGNVSGLVSA
jgi:hypothetical protein